MTTYRWDALGISDTGETGQPICVSRRVLSAVSRQELGNIRSHRSAGKHLHVSQIIDSEYNPEDDGPGTEELGPQAGQVS